MRLPEWRTLIAPGADRRVDAEVGGVTAPIFEQMRALAAPPVGDGAAADEAEDEEKKPG